MKLSELTKDLGAPEYSGSGDIEIGDVAYDSRQVAPGTLFFCVPGLRVDGHDFAPDAARRGAAALVCERRLGLDIPQVVVADPRAAMAPVAARFFGDPSGKLTIVGVTGTNGKTTTSFLVRALLESAGHRCGLLGTVERVVGGRGEPVERTTPEAIDLFRLFRRMYEAGDTACVMEVSSHALALNRCDNIDFDCAIFTNLSQDHLDFHETMDNYFGAKRQLFFSARLHPPKIAVINEDDSYGRHLAESLSEAGYVPVTFAIDEPGADYRAVDLDPDAPGGRFTVLCPGDRGFAVETRLRGLFNVSNILGAVAAALELGADPNKVAEAVREMPPVPGRFEAIDAGQDFAVLVDYAHTPDALENVLLEARKIAAGRLLVVFGCGGDRDREKRPRMGGIASRLADVAIVTSDNPRNEEPEAIIEEIVSGAKQAEGYSPTRVRIEADRREAIRQAFSAASAGDVVLIAGKGHERGQELEAGRKVPFDDREVAREELARLGAASV